MAELHQYPGMVMRSVVVNQMDLFDKEPLEKDRPEPDAVIIRSGRVETVHFGSTSASFGLTRDVLADLLSPPAEEEASS